MKDIMEGSTAYLELDYKDRLRYPITPTALRYRIDDLSSRVSILTWTTVSTPDSENIIEIDHTLNAMHDNSKANEVRVVTSEATFADSAVIVKELRYNLVNLSFY
jgi:hypothetical protein